MIRVCAICGWPIRPPALVHAWPLEGPPAFVALLQRHAAWLERTHAVLLEEST